MNDVIGTGGTWANLGGGSSQKVANFTSLLDNKGVYPYPTQATDLTTEYYGCYDESIKWSDIEYYLEHLVEQKILKETDKKYLTMDLTEISSACGMWEMKLFKN